MSIAVVEPLERPRTRGECARVARPCPWRVCRHNLTAEPKRPAGAPSCTLDVADAGGATLEAVGRILGLTRERIRQLQLQALRHLALLLWDRGALDDDELEAALVAFAGGLLGPGELAG
ncbi:MAG TPA: sigma factor-like helix-turn-helix DNA-binding protein [Polyangia bacterium]|nr:sigma factor-like helix-turn-helix DNA-binding protein [Polyangia bacterium]